MHAKDGSAVSRICLIGGLLVILTLLGALGFYFIEGWSLLDSLYMAVITLSTVGFREVRPLSDGGRVFVIVYVTLGLGFFAYGVAQLGEFIVQARLHAWLGKRRMDTELKSIKDHFIVCGFGRMGRRVAREILGKKKALLVIERSEEALEECKREGFPWLLGDATDDRTLIDAGVEKARGLATVLGSDADNLYVVLSARLLAKDLKILARASEDKGIEKLKRAGADRVVSPYETGASKIAQLLVNPRVEDFMAVITEEGKELDLAEIVVSEQAPYCGKSLAQTDFSRNRVMVIGIRRPNGDLLLPPKSSATIEVGDVLMLLGKALEIQKLIEEE